MQIQHGHLYLANLNPRQGTEPGKLRPVFVIQTNFLNEIEYPSTWILPCTTRLSEENILRVLLPKEIAGNHSACEVMVEQSRAIDNRRIIKQLGEVPPLLVKEIKEKLRLIANL